MKNSGDKIVAYCFYVLEQKLFGMVDSPEIYFEYE